MKAVVVRGGIFDMQVCVPKDWTDEQVSEFAEANNPCGTERGWHIRKKEASQPDYQTRVQCEDHDENIHIMLDA